MLARMRKERNLSQKELAEMTKVNHVQISSYETGRVKPSKVVISKICPALGLEEDFFDEYLTDFATPGTTEKMREEFDRFVEVGPSEFDKVCITKILRSLRQPYEKVLV